ncbi:MAG: DNA translocase FtsK [Candidatus Nealsonbacteria bacterium]
MARKKKRKKNKRPRRRRRKFISFFLSEDTKRHIFGLIFFLLTIIFTLSFFEKAGVAGKFIFAILSFLMGKTMSLLPFILALSGLAFFRGNYKKILEPLGLAISVSLLGISGILEGFSPGMKQGGWLGYIFSWPFLEFFGFWVTQLIFWVLTLIGGLIFWHLLKQPLSEEPVLEEEKKPSFIRKIFALSFKVKKLEKTPLVVEKETKSVKKPSLGLETRPVKAVVKGEEYKMPPLELLDSTKDQPSAGDIRVNSAIIKKTLESFEIPVEMSGVNIGPTVTQYSLKPADGIKLSKITSLSNDLALALANHPIRIEAPIPGKSLVGIEVPNKIRSFVRLKDLIHNPRFQDSPSALSFCLGRDVSGNPLYADLGKMPHLLVAGSTGTGKTIFLNNLILSLVYRNSPDMLKFLLIDPKRVEFAVYNDLPHLLYPAIVDAPRAVNAFQWLIEEMEKRFKLLARAKLRNISNYNEQAFKNRTEHLPYIVLIVDELADLMAAKGREVESGIVRLAQMARAVGIHLVLATQRPSVEVITGLIKANITARITFQVASQIDSRTVLDTGGAEKLLGLGDMLYISSEIIKPKRIQGAYVSEKEVKKVVKWIRTNSPISIIDQEVLREKITEALNKNLEVSQINRKDFSFKEDSLYEEAKRVVIQNKRASASLLQRKLRVGYARAARLIDTLEGEGIVGPSQGAKPRKVYILRDSDEYREEDIQEDKKDNNEWQQV